MCPSQQEWIITNWFNSLVTRIEKENENSHKKKHV